MTTAELPIEPRCSPAPDRGRSRLDGAGGTETPSPKDAIRTARASTSS